jgi:hypothetical protein
MRILVYDRATNTIQAYNRNLSDAMPYIKNRYLTVREFRGSSNSDILWTSSELMMNFNKLREKWGGPIPVHYAFKRIWEGGHSGQSQHYAGLAIDMGQGMSKSKRDALRNLAIKMGIFTYVEPASLTPTWIHVDNRYGTPACGAGYPVLKRGSRGNYVMVLQDALTNLGYTSVASIDGIMGSRTSNAVGYYQRNNRLTVTQETNCPTWQSITSRVVGRGVSSTTILP